MLKIKLVRVGKKHQPSYRIVVVEAKSKLNGKYLDQVGFYNPLTEPHTVRLDKQKYSGWIEKGAQPTERVRSLAKKLL